MYQAVIRITSQILIVAAADSRSLTVICAAHITGFRAAKALSLLAHTGHTREGMRPRQAVCQSLSLSSHVPQVVDLYFEDSGSKLEKLDAQLASPTQPDYNAVDQLVRCPQGQRPD